MSAAQQAAQHAMVIPDNSSSLLDHCSTCTEPDPEEQMCWYPCEDSSAHTSEMPSEDSSTYTSSAAMSEDNGVAGKGNAKHVVDITADCSAAASHLIDNR